MNYKRYRHLSSEVIISLVAFRLQQEWFALPIELIARVIPLNIIYGDPQGRGISLTRYQNQEILVIDVGKQIFGEISENSENCRIRSQRIDRWIGKNGDNNAEERYLVLIKTKEGELIGLPIDSPPSIQRVSQSAFSAIPDAYLRTGNIRCLSSKMVQVNDRPALFLLDPEQLIDNSKFLIPNP